MGPLRRFWLLAVAQTQLRSQLRPKPAGFGLPDTSLEFAAAQAEPRRADRSSLSPLTRVKLSGIDLKSSLFIYVFLKMPFSLQPALLSLHLNRASAQKTQTFFFFFFFLYKFYF